MKRENARERLDYVIKNCIIVLERKYFLSKNSWRKERRINRVGDKWTSKRAINRRWKFIESHFAASFSVLGASPSGWKWKEKLWNMRRHGNALGSRKIWQIVLQPFSNVHEHRLQQDTANGSIVCSWKLFQSSSFVLLHRREHLSASNPVGNERKVFC